MKYIPDSSHLHASDSSGNGLKLGIVRLGRAAGKTKYSLLDERDINLVQQFAFEARLEVDRNGNGAAIYAWCFDVHRGRSAGQFVHNMLWERYCGGIAPGWRIMHMNGITVDNRMDNLALVQEKTHPDQQPTPLELESRQETAERDKDPAASIYWRAMQQLPQETLERDLGGPYPGSSRQTNNSSVIRIPLGNDGEMNEDDCNMYFECRNPPCVRMERELREFSICGRCQTARYCGTSCQQRDWPIHKKYCRERKRYVLGERPPER